MREAESPRAEWKILLERAAGVRLKLLAAFLQNIGSPARVVFITESSDVPMDPMAGLLVKVGLAKPETQPAQAPSKILFLNQRKASRRGCPGGLMFRGNVRRSLDHGVDNFLKLFQSRRRDDDGVAPPTYVLSDTQETAARIFLERKMKCLALNRNAFGLERILIDRRLG